MNTRPLPLALALTLALAACTREQPAPPPAPSAQAAPATQAAPDDHAEPAAHPEHTAGMPAPPPGQRWATDAPLRAGMARVRAATEALAPLEQGRMDAAQVRAQADEIQAAVNTIFAECRLPPEPDAALHPLLIRLMQASRALREKPADPAPLADLHAVLEHYPQMFDDQDWPMPME
ncbi:DnrO protein [Vulcaniibacterium gelatinicum]|uniref:DnrO protein n=1 Tax=Vulcaniibacterium gelatinicum TaxID=2598725 RepID=UPI0011C7908E|nr:DnrO protein [Vulcaniibacterium gelatinicum]